VMFKVSTQQSAADLVFVIKFGLNFQLFVKQELVNSSRDSQANE
jgi:hypothetical protein